MKALTRKSKTFVFALICVAMWGTYFIIQPFYNQVIQWDVSVYYTYLPAVFIYQDVGMQEDWPANLHAHQVSVDRKHQGKVALKMSMGMAFTYLPFFAIAHAYTLLDSAIPANGYMLPYHIAIGMGAVFWCTLGLYFLFVFLRRFVSNAAAGITLFVLIAGTNLGYYTFWEGAMSHSMLFTLMAVFLEVAERYVEKQRLKHALVLGAIIGLSVLIRPILLAHYLFLVGFLAFRVRGKINGKHIFFAAAFAIVWWVPQLVYWKYITGEWLFYSYTNERFFWTDSQILNGLFSWRKGWFIYTPVMLLLAPALVVLFRKNRFWFWLIALLFIVHVYIIFSWWCWWYGGSYGLRAMIELYALLALPIAYFWQNLLHWKWFLALPVYMVALVLVVYNVFTSWQYTQKIIHFDAMSKEAYESIFLQTEQPADFYGHINEADYEAAKMGQRDQ